MELTIGASFALISCLYLSVVNGQASSKCKGQWDIHACWGGNGKRSDPNLGQTDTLPPSLLNRLLLADAQRLSRMLEPAQPDLSAQRGEYEAELGDDMPNTMDEAPLLRVSGDLPTLANIRRYINALKRRHAARERNMDLFVR